MKRKWFIGLKINKEFISEENRNVLEPIDWIKKYLSIDSFSIELELLDSNGIKDKRLISKPIQALNIELEEIDRIVPRKEQNKKMRKSVCIINKSCGLVEI